MMKILFACMIAILPLHTYARDRVADLQSEVDDLRQKIHGYQVERDILEEKFHKQEAQFAKVQKELMNAKTNSQELSQSRIAQLEKRLSALEASQVGCASDLKQLQAHSNETSASLAKFNGKLGDLEQDLSTHSSQLKESMKTVMKLLKKPEIVMGQKTYKVQSGDSLGSIAKNTGVRIDTIKRLNNLSSDRISVGKELILEEP